MEDRRGFTLTDLFMTIFCLMSLYVILMQATGMLGEKTADINKKVIMLSSKNVDNFFEQTRAHY